MWVSLKMGERSPEIGGEGSLNVGLPENGGEVSLKLEERAP